MKPAQISFVKECLPAALSAGTAFNMNPLVILAQAAFESGLGHERPGKGLPELFRTDRLRLQQRLLARREDDRKGFRLFAGFPPLRHARELLPGFRPPDPKQLPLRLAGKQRPAGLRKGDRLQPLYQRAERR